MPVQTFLKFFDSHLAPGILLLLSAALAFVAMNTPLASLYHSLFFTPLALGVAPYKFETTFIHFLNDGLMAIFFLLVGLELKKEIAIGALSERSQLALPALAALGGMIVPAIIFYLSVSGDSYATRGWAIPAATDIAFALGVLSLLGSRVPTSLKVFLTALAIMDDLGAILVIAFFYTAELHFAALGAGLVPLGALYFLNRRSVSRLSPYLIFGLILWGCLLMSGVHATLAGVITALFVPLKEKGTFEYPPLQRLEHTLQPWVGFGILPLFAFGNAGLSFHGVTLETILEPIPIGIILGLFLGKQIGIFGAAFLTIKSGFAKIPTGATWMQIYGVAVIAGIGFTMSLFIAELAYDGEYYEAATRIGVVMGSLLSALVGYVIMRFQKA